MRQRDAFLRRGGDVITGTRPVTPVVILICAPAFGVTLGAGVALFDCWFLRDQLADQPALWWWQCREIVLLDLKEALQLGVAYGVLFACFIIARTRMRAGVELAMRCFGCGIVPVAAGVAAGGPIGWRLGRHAPWLFGWLLPAVPNGVDVATFGALNGTGCRGYLGAAAGLLLSCVLLYRRWRAMQIVASRGFVVMTAGPAPIAPVSAIGYAR
jgi:hypothetical protein